MQTTEHKVSNTRWLAASFLGWTLAVALVWGMDYTKYISGHNMVLFFLNICLILGGGLVLGLITGVFLRRVLG